MAQRERRLARNEDYFREINESLREKHVHAVVVRSGPLPFVCECASPDCTEAVELTLEEYREVRSDPRRPFSCLQYCGGPIWPWGPLCTVLYCSPLA